MGLRTGRCLVIAAAALAGCPAHVALPQAPPRHAPYAARVRAYNAFRPLAIQYTTTVSHGRYGGSSATTATGLLLANGLRVAYPEDLLPLAGERSAMAAEVRESLRVQRIAAPLALSGFGAIVLGAGLVLAAFLAPSSGPSGGSAALPLAAAGGLLVLTGPIPLLVGAGFGFAASGHRETAYQLYEPSLRQNLGLCGDGTQVGDCPTAGEPGGAQQEPPAGANVMPPVRITP